MSLLVFSLEISNGLINQVSYLMLFGMLYSYYSGVSRTGLYWLEKTANNGYAYSKKELKEMRDLEQGNKPNSGPRLMYEHYRGIQLI